MTGATLQYREVKILFYLVQWVDIYPHRTINWRSNISHSQLPCHFNLFVMNNIFLKGVWGLIYNINLPKILLTTA